MTVLRGTLVTLAVALLLLAAVPSLAKGGGDITYPGKTQPAVTFSHDKHAEGMKCTECHTRIWPMKKGQTPFTMADIEAGKFCGTCHDGTKAFSATAEADCMKCHVPQSTTPETPSPSPSPPPPPQ